MPALWPRLTRLALSSVLALGLSWQASAASFDPDLTWRTLETEHFNITFHGGEEALAEEVAKIAEDIWDKMTAELDVHPKRRTEIVLIDHTDIANGYAMTVPVNTIVLFVTAPTEDSTLGLYENWTDAILTHEFTHILHLDGVDGIPAVLKKMFGKIVSVHRASPGWIIEGQATLQETRHTSGGRGRSTVAHMIKRMSVIEDQFPPLGNLDGFQVDPPGGNLRYLFGQDFQQYIADKTGEDVWTKWMHTYGGGIPYVLPSKRVFGERFPALHKQWRAHLFERYGAQQAAVKAQGETQINLLSDGIATCMGPEWSPNGEKIVWSCSDPVDGPGIFVTEGLNGTPELSLKGAFARDFAWRKDSKAVFYSSSHIVNRFNLFDDVWFHKLGKESATAVTSGSRARQPTLSPDGEVLIAVTNKVQQNQLVRLTVDKELKPLTEHTDHTQLSSPRFSPDGRHLALSLWRDGQRDIWIYTADGTPLRRVTQDLAIDGDPAWSADGRLLYFTSDRSGIFNIYAVDLETERLWQVTNVVGGAFHPAPHPSGEWMAYESFSHNGMDIAWLPLGRQAWWDKGTLPLPLASRAPLKQVIPTDLPAKLPPEAPRDDLMPAREAADKEAQSRRLPQGTIRSINLQRIPGHKGWGGGLQGLGFDAVGPIWESPEAGPDTETESNTDEEAPEEEAYQFSYPVRRYNPLPILFPPRFLRPMGTLTYDYGFKAYLGTAAWDTLRRYSYSGYASYRSDNDYIGWGVSAAYNELLPVFVAGAYSYTVRYGDMYQEIQPPSDGGTWLPGIEQTDLTYWDKRTKFYASVSYPMGSYRSIYARWSGTHRTPLVPLDELESQGARIYRQTLPTRGFLSSVGAGWSYGKGKSYGRAVSTEDGRALGYSAKLRSPLLGSYTLNELDEPESFTQLQFGGEWREYMRVPWFDDHVIATKLGGGGSLGDQTRYGSYRLGGNFGEGGLYTLPEEYRALRGFGIASAYGDWYYKGSAEYRLPLWWIDRGLGTLPVFARYIAGAVFMDAGYAFQSLPDGGASILPNTLVGAGAEIRGRAVLSYGGSGTARLGYAFGLNGDGAIPLGSIDGFYIKLDTGF